MVARCFAFRLAEDGIPVFDIRPGVIRTDMTAPVIAKYEKRIADGLSPIRRWGQPEDVGRAIAGLVSGAIPFSTGDAFHIDGGLHMHKL
jgi:NAD(P)-dependent dehydrogenase (short-subunit alcohol dehydrogenase family)